MKKTSYLLFSLLVLGMLFNACSTDVDLYADYKDITVVYGLLDSNMDTNYVKINKAFLGPGNALVIAKNPDSCNYPVGRIKAKIIEYQGSASGNNYTLNRTLNLNPIYIHDKDSGLFYAPEQLVYYTAEKIKTNTDQHTYRYELEIENGDSLLTSSTNMVGGEGFTITTASMDFSGDLTKVKWRPCPNASVYEVTVKFRFIEVGPNNDSVVRIMTWPWGKPMPVSSLEMENNQYIVNHSSSDFYVALATFLGNDTLKTDVDRLITTYPLCISIAAGGEELYNFIAVNGPSSSIVQNLPEYTNIKGGYGVFSSRTGQEKWIRMGTSLLDLIAKENWRFRQG